jgi:hypothetical protein
VGGAGGGGGNGVAGTVNTGGGGGGVQSYTTPPAGGSGIVIFRLNKYATATFSAGVTQTNSTSGLFTTYTVTAAGPTDTVAIS